LKILVLDLETTVERIDGRIDNSPKNPRNKCVSGYWGWLGEDTVDHVKKAVWYHKDYEGCDPTDELRTDLLSADMMVCHNTKFDAEWLLEMGFTLPPLVFDTMVVEYLLSKGQRRPLSLKESAIRRKVKSLKKSELIDEMFRDGVDFSEMPLDVVNEYAEADVKACGELYLAQLPILEREHNQSLKKVIPFMHEMLLFLCEIEMNGVKVDLDALEEVEREFEAEKEILEKRLNEIVEMVMGDTPINLQSGADMTKVVYSREVISREAHQQTFNIGTNEAGKSLRPPFMTQSQFVDAVRATTKIVHKTRAIKCHDCNGMGSVQKYKVKTKIKLGKKYRVQTDEPYKNRTKCKTCTGAGAIYQSTGVAAGLRMSPSSAFDASINGFKTDKETIKGLILQAERKKNDVAVEFLTKSSRLSALSVYLDSFVAGIQRGTRNTGFLHANFNQCVAATGRLSSGGGMSINLQNQPKRGFPVRKCFISRFENGIWIESDYSGLEFRTACELSRDSQGLADILEGKDIHRQTASICLKKPASHVTKDERQGHKWASFQPLFGGTGFGMPDHIKAYFDRFYGIYKGIHGWHQSLMTGTLNNGTVETPSGRQYFWPNVERTKNGRVTSATQILNYPVQGFSADLVQLACIRAFKLFKQADLRSKLTLTVHDSICVDTHPDEIEQVKSILTEAMTGVGEEAEKRFGYKTVVPLDIEISGGPNWLEQQEYA
jgi:DNA polymerase I-like protein with 3'-5' exonuclease and polymerase domains